MELTSLFFSGTHLLIICPSYHWSKASRIDNSLIAKNTFYGFTAGGVKIKLTESFDERVTSEHLLFQKCYELSY